MTIPKALRAIALSLVATSAMAATGAIAAPVANAYDRRQADWRNGAIVYQVLVDRFAPSGYLDAKRHLFAPPKVLRGWSETAHRGTYLPAEKLYSHELDFWGGDLPSLTARLDYIQELGAEVIYLNPIHLAYTNHKYDAFDFKAISPEYGTMADFKRLAEGVHRRGMKVVLDGVFNHMGRNAPIFKDAQANPKSPWRDWFVFGPQYPTGVRVWTDAENLPELNLENPNVRAHLYGARDSVVRSLLRAGADGWRLDTAYELGHTHLRDLTRAAHQEKPGSLVVGEIVNYPGEWLKSMDSVMGFAMRHIVLGVAQGQLPTARAMRMTDQLVADAGIEPTLKSWMVIDNHDIPRITHQLPDVATRRMAQALQFTLPGAPNIYYGAELGMTGGGDPENRSPMRWDLLKDDNPELVWMRQLIALRKANRALRVGDFRSIDADQLYAFERHTDRALDTVIVVVNPSDRAVTERLMVRHANLMDDTPMVDALQPQSAPVATFSSGFFTAVVPAKTAMVLKLQERAQGGYSRYKRVK